MPVAVTTDRVALARLHRRAGWGLSPGDLDRATALGVEAAIDRLVNPDAHDVAPAPDPWSDVELTLVPPLGPTASKQERRRARATERAQAEAAIDAWLDHLIITPRPLEDWMAWFWHGHFVSALDKVKQPFVMVQQLRTFRAMAFAPLPALARAAAVDPAMLRYLDGNTSTAAAPNENFSRELLELFTIGIGHYTEDDVKAGARALTGWTIDRRTGRSQLVKARHDGGAQRYLGCDGVHDVDTVIAAATALDACAPFIAGKFARTLLGAEVDDATIDDLARPFAASGLDPRVLVRAVLERIVMPDAPAIVLPPVPWLVSAQRATGANLAPHQRLAVLKAAGQLPMLPPSVAGWPIGTAWFGASTVVARYGLATMLATATPDGPALAAASTFDVDTLADVLGRPEGFSDATRAALGDVRSDPRAVLALALSSADLSIA